MLAVNYMGRNYLEGASQQIKDLGLKKALIVTDAVSRLCLCCSWVTILSEHISVSGGSRP